LTGLTGKEKGKGKGKGRKRNYRINRIFKIYRKEKKNKRTPNP
jgi:hypothetical protein